MLIGLVVCLWKIWKASATSHGNTKTIAAIRLFAMNQFSLLAHHLRCPVAQQLYYRSASSKSRETKPFYYSIENCTGFSLLENYIECHLLTGPQIYDNRDTFSYMYGKEIPLVVLLEWNANIGETETTFYKTHIVIMCVTNGSFICLWATFM